MLKHFLTIVRTLEYKSVKEERRYYYDKKRKEITEMFDYYDLDSGNFIMQEVPKVKSMPAKRFIQNLDVLECHPCKTWEDSKFIVWYAKQILKDKF